VSWLHAGLRFQQWRSRRAQPGAGLWLTWPHWLGTLHGAAAGQELRLLPAIWTAQAGRTAGPAGGSALKLCFKMRRSALLLALCGLAVSASAMVAAPAPAPREGMPKSADVLLPETDADVVTLLSHFMSAQHEVVLATHGPVRCLACHLCAALAWPGAR